MKLIWRERDNGGWTLFYGPAYIGHVGTNLPRYDWRTELAPRPEEEWESAKRRKNRFEHYLLMDKTPWYGWFMSGEDGAQTGMFQTVEEARLSVEEAFAGKAT
jgi:hypothetical protein